MRRPRWRKKLSKVFAEAGVGGKAHDELWADVGVALGIAQNDLTSERAIRDLWPTDRLLVEGHIQAISNSESFQIALCCMMGVEMISPGLSKFFPCLEKYLGNIMELRWTSWNISTKKKRQTT